MHQQQQMKTWLVVDRTAVNFINILRTNFSYERRFFYIHVTRKKLQKRSSFKKFARTTLMKLTPACLQSSARDTSSREKELAKK